MKLLLSKVFIYILNSVSSRVLYQHQTTKKNRTISHIPQSYSKQYISFVCVSCLHRRKRAKKKTLNKIPIQMKHTIVRWTLRHRPFFFFSSFYLVIATHFCRKRCSRIPEFISISPRFTMLGSCSVLYILVDR